MRFIHLYLIGYFVLVLGAGLALWQAGVLAHVSGIVDRHRRAHRRRPRHHARGDVRQARRSLANRPSSTAAASHSPVLPARRGTRYGSASASHASRDRRLLRSSRLALCPPACKEDGTIKVHSLTFKGVKAVDEGRLKDALATRQSSKIPWGKKYLLRPLALRRRSEAHPGVLRRPRISRRARHRLRRQAQRQAGRGRSHGHDRRRRAGARRSRSTSPASTSSRPRTSTI